MEATRRGTPGLKRRSFIFNEILFVGPMLLAFLLFKGIPLLLTFVYSLTNWNGISQVMEWTGMDNYQRLFADTQYWSSFWFTLRFAVVSVLLANVVGFALAWVLNKPLKMRNAMRAGFYLPNTIGGLVLGFVWRFVFVTAFNYLGKHTDIPLFKLAWLSTPATSFWAMVWVQVWVLSGYLMLLYISGLSVLPGDVMESAKIDGAGPFQTLLHVTLPMLMLTITRCLFLSFLTCMRVYDINLSLTGGNPYRSSESITLNVYTTAFTENQMGYGCAKALLFVLIVILISFLQMKWTSGKEVTM